LLDRVTVRVFLVTSVDSMCVPRSAWARQTLMDLVARQRAAAHIGAARRHEQSVEFFAGIEQLFAALGDAAGEAHARPAANEQRSHAARERRYAQSSQSLLGEF